MTAGSPGPCFRRRGNWQIGLTALGLLLAPALASCGSSGAVTPGGSGSAAGAGDGTTVDASTASAITATGGAGTGTSPGATAGPSQATPKTATVSVYYLHGKKLAPAHRGVTAPGTVAGAVRALLAAPTAAEARAGWTSAIPAGTALRGVSVHGGVATIDLTGRYAAGGGSLPMHERLAQVVFTATRFPTVKQVVFQLDGRTVTVFGDERIKLTHPVGRSAFEGYSPAVLVESPVIGDTVRDPLRVWGSADVFEAVFRLAVVDPAGRTVADVQVKASSGSGTRGTFDVTVPYRSTAPTGTGRLVAYYLSAKNGSRVVVATIPITVTRTG
jgi:hypothetical protein